MKYIPKINSFKDFIFWPLRFFFNLPLQWQAIIGLALTLPLVVIMIFSKNESSEGQIVKVAKTAYLKTGCLENNIDSLKIRSGESLKLLARQGSLLWAETTDGKNRGFVKASDILDNSDELTLPDRRGRSSYFITKNKFEELIEDTLTTLQSLQKDYINAEYLRPSGKNIIGEFGFYVIDSLGTQLRPVITFDSDGSVADYSLEFWRYRRGFIHNSEIDILSPLISTKEFQVFSPFDNWFTNLVWTYLIGFIPVFLFVIILWMRYPLIWMPNFLVNLIIYFLIIAGPVLWCSMLRLQGVMWMPVVPVTGILLFVSCLLFWAFFSGLRCPRCKNLIYHEHIGTLFGKQFITKERNSHEIARRNIKHTTSGYWEYKLEKVGNEYVKVGVMKHSYVDEVTYREYEIRSLIQPLTKQYSCPKCGHGNDEKSQKVLESETIPLGTYTVKEEYTRMEAKG